MDKQWLGGSLSQAALTANSEFAVSEIRRASEDVLSVLKYNPPLHVVVGILDELRERVIRYSGEKVA